MAMFSKRSRSDSMLVASQADAPVGKLSVQVDTPAPMERDETSPRTHLDLNSCSINDLNGRLCLGDALSQRILDYRPYNDKDKVISVLKQLDSSAVTEDLEGLIRKTCRVRPSMLAASGSILQCWENTRLHILAPETIKRAWFGHPDCKWLEGRHQGMICTEIVVKRACSGKGVVASCACIGKDPAPGVFKQLCVELSELCPATAETGSRKVYKTPIEVPSWPRWLAFVRHAQAQHNVDNNFLDHPDTLLTTVGVAQASQGRDDAAGDAMRNANIVVTSPMTRAMQTTGLLLGSNDALVPVAVHALCTERWSSRCDEGTPKTELLGREAEGFPDDFHSWGGWDQLPEQWWATPAEDQWERVEAFYSMAKDRPEDRIVFVGHGGFWNSVVGHYLDNCEVVYCDRSLT